MMPECMPVAEICIYTVSSLHAVKRVENDNIIHIGTGQCDDWLAVRGN
jgi:hypothetical protein